MHVFLFERNLNFFHEFVPAAQISLARSALFFGKISTFLSKTIALHHQLLVISQTQDAGL